MYSQILRRAGGVLVAIGIIGEAVTIARVAGAARLWLAALDCIAIVAGACLLWGGPRAALWVRTLAVFVLAGGVMVVIAASLFQPLDLSITEIRLDPGGFTTWAATLAIAICVTLWVSLQLGRPAVRDAIAGAGIRRWDMRFPAQAGGGIVALAALLLWLALHGQSGELATSLALQQLGPDYRYHLSWISSARNGRGTTVTGIVTAWNHKEIKQVVLHWATPR